MKYLLSFESGVTHFWGGAQILTMDDKLHTKERSLTTQNRFL